MLYQISDIHLFDDPAECYRGVCVESRLDTCIAFLLDKVTTDDTLIITGDVCQFNQTRAYTRLAEALAKLPCQIAWIPGNHDSHDAMAAVAREFAIISGENTEVQLDNHWKLILLHSDYLPDGVGGASLREASIERLVEQIAHTDQHILLAIHHPFYPVSSAWQDAIKLANGDQLLAQLYSLNRPIKAICGHVHQYHHIANERVELVSSPAVAAQFKKYTAELTLEDSPAHCGPGLMAYQLGADGQWSYEPIYLPAYR